LLPFETTPGLKAVLNDDGCVAARSTMPPASPRRRALPSTISTLQTATVHFGSRR